MDNKLKLIVATAFTASCKRKEDLSDLEMELMRGALTEVLKSVGVTPEELAQILNTESRTKPSPELAFLH